MSPKLSVPAGARLLPDGLVTQRRVISRLHARDQRDVFRTTYPLNAPRAVRRRAASAAWRLIVQGWTAEPACSGRWQRLFTLMDVLDRALPEICGADWFAFRKRW